MPGVCFFIGHQDRAAGSGIAALHALMVSNILDLANEYPAKPPYPLFPAQPRILEVFKAREEAMPLAEMTKRGVSGEFCGGLKMMS